MKILILGGTKFLGRHLVDKALENNHEVTLFNRGRKYTDEEITNVERIYGDRSSDLDKLSKRRWDAVIDTCGYLPQTVKSSAEFLRDKVNHYVFISSGSVYQDTKTPDYDETTRTRVLSPQQKREVSKICPQGELTGAVLGENYGALKVLCENAAERAMLGRVLNVRAGMIVGAFDPTDRFAYWVMRIAQGGEILVPGTGELPVQLIDARDLSKWIVKMVEQNKTGTFNVSGKPLELTFSTMLDAIKTATKTQAKFVWAKEKFLNETGIVPWKEMPFYLHESDENLRNFLTMNVNKALTKGLKLRPLQDTILETFYWRKKQTFAIKAGISAGREKKLLEKLKFE